MNKGSYFITFAIGAVIGSVVTYLLLKKKNEQKVQEEVKKSQIALREYYRSTNGSNEGDTEECVKKEYSEIIDKCGYKSNAETEKEVPEEYEEDYISILTPDEFGEHEDYRVISLDYFAGDGVLVDDAGNPLDISETIGEDAINHFGEFEEKVVFVRNENIKTDFEVLLDPRKYSEVFNKDE